MRGIQFTLGCACATALLACAPAGNQGPSPEGDQVESSGTPDNLTSSEWSAYVDDQEYIHRLAKPGQRVRLNLADPRQYSFARARLKLVGKDPGNSPYLFELIEARREKHLSSKLKSGTFAPDAGAHSLVPSGPSAEEMHYIETAKVKKISPTKTDATGTASSTIPGGSWATGLDVNVSTVTGYSISPFAYIEQYENPNGVPGANVTIKTVGNANLSNIKRWRVSSYKWEDSEKFGFTDSYTYTEVGSQNQLIMGTVPNLSVVNTTAPVEILTPYDNIIDLCMDRQWTWDCDYIIAGAYDQALKVPLAGDVGFATAHRFDEQEITRIKDMLQDCKDDPVNCVVDRDVGEMQLVLTHDGGGCRAMDFTLTAEKMYAFWNTVTWEPTVNPTRLRWNLTQAAAAYFDNGCRQSQNVVKFTARIPLPTKESGQPSFDASMTISSDPNVHADSVLKTLTMTNSCLAKGTQIQLGNGKLAPIESLHIGQDVFSPYDRGDHALTITDTAKGSERAPMVRIRDGAGRTLLMTEMHPIATADRGMVQARHLRTGDVVMTQQGPSKLTEVSREPYTGHVYNLKVGSETERASLGHDQTILYANGFIVGDGQIQSKYEALSKIQETSRTVEQIPEQWHRDHLLSPQGR